MKISKDRQSVVETTYQLYVDNQQGEPALYEERNEEDPLLFLYGTGAFLPKFEEALDGLDEGQEFDFKIACDDAYGDYDEKKTDWLPIEIFEVDGKVDMEMLQEGRILPMIGPDGDRVMAEILTVKKDKVEMDFNHPLSGYDLIFKGKILSVRMATKEEIEHGHAHPGGSCDH
ncbi:peptidyl-prolyl cis-trans isomerase [Fulvitalea axinellae]|uniref:Peptidyl-prolyl cis-trans isomerase n=1 Tax=Fulvitalea axinellae TaxID=1182444 RepID=A0AAU9CG43_9BACT|nr:peptidyl-prolyl cis-trans isomerase [Fulvitalea axinellae]